MKKISIKREQSQAGLSFAEREKFRPQVKNKLLLLLALLLTAATGAWAANTVTWTAQNQLPTLEGKTTATIDGVTITTPSAITVSSGRATFNGATFSVTEGNITKIVLKSISGVTDYPTGWTISDYTDATWTGSAKSVSCGYSGDVYSIEFTIENVYTVTMAKGTVDATNWTINPAEAAEGTEVTLQYNGRLKVKGVKATSDEAAEASVPDGALSGVFSVSDTKKVYFSKGNLQATYNGTDWTWAFAENQWDYIGNAAGNTSVNGNGTVSASNVTVDLFGWVGASSTWTGAAQYGISNSTATDNTDGYGNVAREALKSDWGNTIGTGWFTLSKDEWTYLFNTRTTGGTVFGTAQARYAHATINTDGTGVNGMILFPDGVDIASTEVTTAGSVNATSAYATKCTTAQWAALAAKGCVFLPAAGNRNQASVYSAGSGGYYWSSSPNTSSSYYAYRVIFLSGNLSLTTHTSRYLGYSVRLVQEVAPNP